MFLRAWAAKVIVCYDNIISDRLTLLLVNVFF